MSRKHVTILSCALAAVSLAIASPSQSQSQRSLQLNIKDNAAPQNPARIRCRAEAAILIGSSVALDCRGQNGKYGLLILPANQTSTHFALSLVDKDLYRYFVVTPDPGSANCQKARQNSSLSRPCYKVESARLSAKDSPVNVGNANPNSGPSIPTAPANPDWPNIPTQPAQPN